MTRRYVMAPQAARDLVEIWRCVKREVRACSTARLGRNQRCVSVSSVPAEL